MVLYAILLLVNTCSYKLVVTLSLNVRVPSMMTSTIFGYGSLMNISSARSTMPCANNFRKGILNNYVRVYSLVSIGGIRKGQANLRTKEVAALAIRPDSGMDGDGPKKVFGILFDIPTQQLLPYLEREHRYRPVEVEVESIDEEFLDENISSLVQEASRGKRMVTAWTVVEQTDEEYFSSLPGGLEEWNYRISKYYTGLPSDNDNVSSPIFGNALARLWGRNDIFPMPGYLVLTLEAAYSLGKDVWLNNMLDYTYLADNSTTVREYLRNTIFQQYLSRKNNGFNTSNTSTTENLALFESMQNINLISDTETMTLFDLVFKPYLQNSAIHQCRSKY